MQVHTASEPKLATAMAGAADDLAPKGLAELSAIDIIEAALGDAKRGAASSKDSGILGMDYSEADAAQVSAYGAQLRSWIDIQVEVRLNAELSTLKAMQSKLFTVVEGLSAELAQLKAVHVRQVSFAQQGVVVQQQSIAAQQQAVAQAAHQAASVASQQAQQAIASQHAVAAQAASAQRQAQQATEAQAKLSEDLDRLKASMASCELALKTVDGKEINKLRAETVAALQTEADAITRLDKRLVLLDQRLEKRISDVLVHRPSSLSMATRDESPSPSYRNSKPQGFLLAKSLSMATRDEHPSPAYRDSSPSWNIIGGRLISERAVR
jgi:hypothetical protein